jgi:hypothetical protein
MSWNDHDGVVRRDGWSQKRERLVTRLLESTPHWNYWTLAPVLLPTVGDAEDDRGEFARPLSGLLHAGARGRLFTGRPLL